MKRRVVHVGSEAIARVAERLCDGPVATKRPYKPRPNSGFSSRTDFPPKARPGEIFRAVYQFRRCQDHHWYVQLGTWWAGRQQRGKPVLKVRWERRFATEAEAVTFVGLLLATGGDPLSMWHKHLRLNKERQQ